MIEYKELRNDIDRYLMERFKYSKSLVYLTVDNIIATRRNSRIDLYLRIRRVGFSKERIGHGTHFLRFLTEVARKYSFNYIGIECANIKSSAFANKLGFYSINDENYAIAVTNLISYSPME